LTYYGRPCDSLESFGNVIDEFLGLLDSHIGRVTSNWKETGVYIAVTNVASLLSYGAKDAKFRLAFVQAIKSHLKQAQRAPMTVEHALQQDVESVLPLALSKGNEHPSLLPHATQERLGKAAEFEIGAPEPQNLDLRPEITLPHAVCITFLTFALVLQHIGHPKIYRP